MNFLNRWNKKNKPDEKVNRIEEKTKKDFQKKGIDSQKVCSSCGKAINDQLHLCLECSLIECLIKKSSQSNNSIISNPKYPIHGYKQ